MLADQEMLRRCCCSQVPFILDQLEQIQLKGGSHPFANRPLVILADKDKDELDGLVSFQAPQSEDVQPIRTVKRSYRMCNPSHTDCYKCETPTVQYTPKCLGSGVIPGMDVF